MTELNPQHSLGISQAERRISRAGVLCETVIYNIMQKLGMLQFLFIKAPIVFVVFLFALMWEF